MRIIIYHTCIEAFYTGVEEYFSRRTGRDKPIILKLYSAVRGFFYARTFLFSYPHNEIIQ